MARKSKAAAKQRKRKQVQQKRVKVRVAAQLHDEWRRPRKLSDSTSFEPRLKTLRDGSVVDIANSDFHDLPYAYKDSNLRASHCACVFIESSMEDDVSDLQSTAWMELAASNQHDNWMEVNREWAEPHLLVAYVELSEEEKEKDRAIVRIAVTEYEQYILTGFTLMEMSAKKLHKASGPTTASTSTAAAKSAVETSASSARRRNSSVRNSQRKGVQQKRVKVRVASRLHDEWRRRRQLADGVSYEPRIKTLPDGNVVDIANTVFHDLPFEFKDSNLRASHAACVFIEETMANDPADLKTSEWIELAADILHETWMDTNKEWADPHLLVAYAELSEGEKEQDRAIVRIALKEYELYIKTGFTLQEMSSKAKARDDAADILKRRSGWRNHLLGSLVHVAAAAVRVQTLQAKEKTATITDADKTELESAHRREQEEEYHATEDAVDSLSLPETFAVIAPEDAPGVSTLLDDLQELEQMKDMMNAVAFKQAWSKLAASHSLCEMTKLPPSMPPNGEHVLQRRVGAAWAANEEEIDTLQHELQAAMESVAALRNRLSAQIAAGVAQELSRATVCSTASADGQQERLAAVSASLMNEHASQIAELECSVDELKIQRDHVNGTMTRVAARLRASRSAICAELAQTEQNLSFARYGSAWVGFPIDPSATKFADESDEMYQHRQRIVTVKGAIRSVGACALAKRAEEQPMLPGQLERKYVIGGAAFVDAAVRSGNVLHAQAYWEAHRDKEVEKYAFLQTMKRVQLEARRALEREQRRTHAAAERHEAALRHKDAALRHEQARRKGEARKRARLGIVLKLANSALRLRLDAAQMQSQLLNKRLAASMTSGVNRLALRIRTEEESRNVSEPHLSASQKLFVHLVDARDAIGVVEQRLARPPKPPAPQSAARLAQFRREQRRRVVVESPHTTAPPRDRRAERVLQIEAALEVACDTVDPAALRSALRTAESLSHRSGTTRLAAMLLREASGVMRVGGGGR